MPGDELMTPAEVARVLKFSPPAVRDLVSRGKLPALRPGAGARHLRFRKADVAAYLERCRVAGRGGRPEVAP